MATRTPSSDPSPWRAVRGTDERESVAPSKPAMPTTSATPAVPQPIDVDEAEVIAPVQSPPDEEIMPSAGGAIWEAVPSDSEAPAAPRDPVQELGDSAVRNASLAASGAPTPLGGVPLVPGAATDAPAPWSPPAPWIAGDPRDNAPDGAAEWSANSPHSPSAEPMLGTRDDAPLPDLENGPAYTPPFGVGQVTQGEDVDLDTEAAPAGAGDDDGTTGQTDEPATPWWRSAVFLIIVGLIVMGGVGYGVYTLLAPPDETVTLTPEVIVTGPPAPALDPIEIADPTDFQAALPTTVGAYALIGLEAQPTADAGLVARAAEVNLLTYSDQTTTLDLRAIQHFDEQDAVAQFEALATDSTDRQPVEAGGTQVGERATVPGEGGETIVWRNGTVVFQLSGPTEEAEAFYALYPL